MRLVTGKGKLVHLIHMPHLHMPHLHMPKMHVGNLPGLVWAEKILSDRRFWIVVATVVLVGLFVLLMIWLSGKGVGGGEDFYNPFLYGP